MKGVTIFLALFICAVRSADNTGQYRPTVYGNNGKYRGFERYDPYFGRYNNYYNNNAQYNYRPFQELQTPYGTYGEIKRNDQASVTSRPTSAKPTTTITPVVYTLASKNTVQPTTRPIYERKQYNNEGSARIVSQDSDFDANNYQFSYLTDNGISAGESGVVDLSENGGGTRVKGFYEFIGADGLKYRVDYTADENGFHPTGAHLP